MADILTVVEKTTPTLTKQRKVSVRNESADATSNVNITGYTISLIVKQKRTLADSRAHFDLAASIVSGADGTYSFAFNLKHTALPPGDYPGTIRFWSGSTQNPPDDAVDVTYRILANADLTIL